MSAVEFLEWGRNYTFEFLEWGRNHTFLMLFVIDVLLAVCLVASPWYNLKEPWPLAIMAALLFSSLFAMMIYWSVFETSWASENTAQS